MRTFRFRAVCLLALACVAAAAARHVYTLQVQQLKQSPLYEAGRYRFGALSGVDTVNPTTLQFGPDGALYVATRRGSIHRLVIERHGGLYRATHTETIPLVEQLPNHDDQGRPQPGIHGRLVTGIAVAGSAKSPVIYVASSDPRLERPEIDTNSGILSRLTLTAAGWRRDDLLRGLPRSRNDHAPNGIALDPDGRTLYLSIGGATNMGAPSEPFLGMSETTLTAAILAVDLHRLGNTTLDLPTPDDPARPGPRDENDPFGGSQGRNMASLPANGAVRIHAEGLRNAYDLLPTPAGLVTIDNGSNAGYGGPPRGLSTRHRDEVVEGGESLPNPLYVIPRAGLFLGHPNPARPIPASPAEPPLLHFLTSTNGLAAWPEDPASGRISFLTVSLDRSLSLVTFERHSGSLQRRLLLAEFGGMPLDVTLGAAPAASTESIWIADMGQSAIYILEPLQGQPLLASPLVRQPVRTLLTRFVLWWSPVREGIRETQRLLRVRWASR